MSDSRRRIQDLSPKRLMLLALDQQSRLEELERRRTEPIAIVGIGCHLPGAENGPEDFWQLLDLGKSAISAVPEDRWDVAAYYDPDVDAPGRMASKWGGFLSRIDRFDAPFFGIAGREANSVDPQHRMLLEVCWEALEHAGHSPRKFSGTATGVFVGICASDYQTLLLARGEETIDSYLASGTAPSIAAGRISYALGLQGPSIAVDTACSASLVAVHLACQSLRVDECRMALAGGVNAILSPKTTIALSKAHMMASDGRCKTFDGRADGFVRGEGCGMVVLKRLSDAQADGDHVLAVIRGSAVNQDGRSSGITAPSGMAQEAVIRAALAQAGVKPEEIGYVEAHGTGTSLGDPIEAHALAAVLGPGRGADNPLVVGSVKTNVGHLEAAAGIAGLIKAVLALQHEQIPAHLHFQQMNPHIDWGGVPVEIPVQGRPWPRSERRRLAGVSSFGFSGTNAHVIVEEAPTPPVRPPACERPLHLLALSARTESALRELGDRYAEVLQHTPAPVGDVCFTANAGRAHFEHRLAVTGSSSEELRDALLKALPGRHVRDREGIRPVFLFPGQGAQYPGMGMQLYDTQPVFRAALDQCAELLRGELETPLLEVLWGTSTALLEQTAYTQPGLFAVEYALAVLWRSWGIEPAAVLGHSVGEYVAACVAGVYSLGDGLKLIARRGRLMQSVAGHGAMAAVHATENHVRDALRGLESRVTIAAINAPESLVISGYEQELHIAEQRLMESDVSVQRLNVSHAFHSPQMHEMEEAFEAVAREIQFQPPRMRLLSSVTGRAVARDEMSHAAYWRRQVSEPVRFRQAMETLRESDAMVFLEVGPGATLAGLGQQCIDAPEALWLPSLRRKREEWPQMLDSLSQLYVYGAEINWAAFDQPYPRRRLPLPTYPFQRQRYWLPATSTPKTPSPPTQTSRDIDDPADEVPSDWFYEIAWQPLQWQPGSSNKATARRWLIVPNSGGLVSGLAYRIREDGGQAIVATSPEDVAAHLHSEAYDFVIYLAGAPNDDLANGPAIQLAEALEAVKAVVVAQSAARLWIITSAAQQVLPGQAGLNLVQAPLWGLGRTVALEHPDCWGGLLDLDPHATVSESCEGIISAIRNSQQEDQVALRSAQAYGARLVRRASPSGPAPRFNPERAYLITGGLSGLGLKVATWMAGRGARRLALLSRRAPAEEATVVIEKLRRDGVRVETYAADVSSMPQMETVFRDISNLGGVVHCAGVLDDGVLTQQTANRMERVLAPKIMGAWNLHRLTAGLSLEFFVMFSSVASLTGSSGQASYAAGNAFLDALACDRRSNGLTALSINWGGWAETGMAARSVTQRRRDTPLTLMPVDQALTAMGGALLSQSAQVCIAAINWHAYKNLYASHPFLSNLRNEDPVGSDRAHSAGGRVAESQTHVFQLLNSSPGERKGQLVQYLAEILAPILGVAVESLDLTYPITDFGLDSLMALEFRNRINSELRVVVPTISLLKGPCLEELAGRLAAEMPEPELRACATRIPDSASGFPLSFGQQEWWFGHKIMPGSPAFNIAFSVKASPGIEWHAFERAVAKLTARHSALRTVFLENDAGIPAQRVLPEVRPDLILIDANSWSEECVREAIVQDFQRPLTVDRPMFCVSVFRCSDHDVLFFKVDHIIIDHWSARVCLEDLRKLYAAELNGTEADLEPIETEYRDFVDWEAAVVDGEGSEALWEYWKQKLSGELPILRLPSVGKHSGALIAQGQALPMTFDPDTWEDAQRIAREHRATGYSFLLAAFQLLLYRYTGQEDIVVGTSASGREDPRWENMIGLFINLLPLRADLSGNPTFAEYLGRVRDTVLEALDHQAFPFSELVTRLRPPRTAKRNPVFQSFFNFLTDRSGVMGVLFGGGGGCALDFGRSTLRPHMARKLEEVRGARTMTAMNRPELMMHLAEIQGRLMGYLDFNSDVLDSGIAAEIAADYSRLLDAIVHNPNTRIKDLLPDPLPVASEREEIVL